jgi:DNA-binding LytR/AlgR family response regulator
VSRRYISTLILFIVLFSGLFLWVYDSFDVSMWFSSKDMLCFLMTIIFYVASVVILIISRTIMYALQDRVQMSISRYVWWLFSECVAIALLYTLITASMFPQPNVTIPDLALRSIMCTILILTIPNAIISFYAAYRSKCDELAAAQYQLQRAREENVRLTAIQESDNKHIEAAMQAKTSLERNPRMVNLRDNTGTLRLTINVDSLYYLQSEDNYINVHYKHNDKIASYLLRCRTKLVEQMLQGTGMVRCHRSYIVNTSKIRFIGEEHRMYYLMLDDDSIKRIPVSKSYYEQLMSSVNTLGNNITSE